MCLMRGTYHKVTAQTPEQLLRQRRIQNTVKNLRWSVLQKGKGSVCVELKHFDKHFVKKNKKKRPRRKIFLSDILLKLYFEWKI